ncbi:MAG: YfhO family protein [Bacteroidetes bacterium]|nr:YfhO family protein [Bacteroidota bacterium]
MINCWIPWRFHISECLQNHIFPFWNPYQQLGYPIHADLQGPTWYFESLILSLTTGQTNYTIQFLFVFYVFIGGMGMYFLSLYFQPDKKIAFWVGVSYMLSGFFVSHVMHFYAIISVAWLPYIIRNYLLMSKDHSYKHALYTSIYMFFSLTGGNHTFTIILSYLLITLFVFFLYQFWKNNLKIQIWQLIKVNALFVFSVIVMSCVVWVAYLQTSPYVERLNGMSYSDAAVCPFSPVSFLSFLVPFATDNSRIFFNTDPSMCNLYIGIISLILIGIIVFTKKKPLDYVFLIFSFFCFIASMGDYTPFHYILFRFFPLLNLFRFPSYYGIFSVLLLLILSGQKLYEVVREPQKYKKLLFRFVILIGIVLLGLIIFALVKNGGHHLFFLKKHSSIFDFVLASSVYQNIILHASILLVFTVIFGIMLYRFSPRYWINIILLFTVLDMFIAVQLTIANCSISSTSPKEIHKYMQSKSGSFPKPDLNVKIADNIDKPAQDHGLFYNTNTVQKTISGEVFNSYILSNYTHLVDSFPSLYYAVLQNPAVYFSSEIYPRSMLHYKDTTQISHSALFLADEDYSILSNNFIPKDPSLSSIEIFDFSPNSISLSVNTSKNQLLTYIQSYYIGWRVSVDGKQTKLYQTNGLTLSVLVTEGQHKVRFYYNNPAIIIAAAVSYSAFIIILLFLLFRSVLIYRKVND